MKLAVIDRNILHSDKRDIVLGKVKKALCPGGVLILKCRIADCPDTIATALAKLVWLIYGGRELFTLEKWQGFLTSYGFTDIQTVNISEMSATIIAKN